MKTSGKDCVLLEAKDIQLHAKQLGFDWSEPAPVFDKVNEELDEVREACTQAEQQKVEEELGDLLFTIVNLCRHLNVCPQKALTRANSKFSQRFVRLQALAKQRNIDITSASLDNLEALWTDIK